MTDRLSIRFIVGGIVLLRSFGECNAQPRVVNGGIEFSVPDNGEKAVSLVGDFNGWVKGETPLGKVRPGKWAVVKKLSAGMYQYKFVLDGEQWILDPHNRAAIENYKGSGKNSVFVLTEDGEILLTDVPPAPKENPSDKYPAPSGEFKPVYLNIIWHQHQPLYVDPGTDQLQGPWVRTHATKDYFDMAAMLRIYPNVHCTINLTSSLLLQLREYYVNRLGPFVNTKSNTIDIQGFWRAWKGRTDPWIDLALKPTSEFDSKDKDYLYRNAWNAFGISDVMIDRFPEYLALKKKLPSNAPASDDVYTEQELRELKFWFYLAYFDPEFLAGPVLLPDGSVCDLSSYVGLYLDMKYHLKKAITEEDCHRMVVEAYKVAANVIPVHRKLRYDPQRQSGQVEIITTPFYHPILPLIYNSDLARLCQPNDSLPPRFSYPQDANAQVTKAVVMYRELFGSNPTGMWPGEGSVAQPILGVLARNGILWTASDEKVLKHSIPLDQPNTSPFWFPVNEGRGPVRGNALTLVFRDTELSDRIGFTYQNYIGEEAAEDFVRTILSRAPRSTEEDVLVTVILDGENAWEWYRHDVDGKDFLNALYRKLNKLHASRQIITTTTTEYILGNRTREIMPHPGERQRQMKWLYPGSWINGNFDTWIGEPEENTAWQYLLRARTDLEKSGIQQPDPNAKPPKPETKEWYGYMAWEAMYSAEGSDWFWWYGTDQNAGGGDKPFDDAFRIHLQNVYRFANRAGASITDPGFAPIIHSEQGDPEAQAAMAKSQELQKVLFTCDATTRNVPRAIYIVGNTKELAEWTPNVVMMYDDSTHGDEVAGDGIWSLQLEVPVGVELQYKYTNSGKKGEWVPGEEFSSRNRNLKIPRKEPATVIVKDIFGK
jgi:alpha-amylase/alpha-mannosidase (GH57 family)